MKICPRCLKKTLRESQALNSLSRRDNNTYICNDCGDAEAFIDNGYIVTDETERRFVKSLNRKEQKS